MCQHAKNGICTLSTTLAGVPVALDEAACAACKRSDYPMDLNGVVCSRAIWGQRQAGAAVDRGLLDCVKESQKDGPGTELKLLLERWIKPDESCGCNARIARMNMWGVEGCRNHLETIVGWIVGTAIERHAWLTYVPVSIYIRRLVKQAIRNASRKKTVIVQPVVNPPAQVRIAKSSRKCPYAEHSICQMATRIGGVIVKLDTKACEACLKQAVPMSVNRITSSLACEARSRAGLQPDQDLSQMALGVYKLAGYRVERKIRKWLKKLSIAPPQACDCNELVSKMNAWGANGSLDRIDEIVDELHNLSVITSAGITKATIKRVLTRWLLNARS